jgi:hypothetical protein
LAGLAVAIGVVGHGHPVIGCGVIQELQRIPDDAFLVGTHLLDRASILMASGRVPKVIRIFFIKPQKMNELTG